MADQGRSASPTLWFGLRFLGQTTLPSKFCSGAREDTIGDFISKHLDDNSRSVAQIKAANTSSMVDNNNNNTGILCEVNMPLGVAYDLGVRFSIQLDETPRTSPNTNAFDILMKVRRNYDKLPSQR